jgi:hypothetical protein
MKKSERIGMVRRAVEEIERRKAEALAACERNVLAGQAKLDELEAYRGAYVRDFSRRAGSGMNGADVREYQIFLTRLDEALRHQVQILGQAKLKRAAGGCRRQPRHPLAGRGAGGWGKDRTKGGGRALAAALVPQENRSWQLRACR